MSYQIQHIYHGFYCGDHLGLSYWWPLSGLSLPIFKFKDKPQAWKLIDSWIKTYGLNKDFVTIQEYDEKLSKKISMQGCPIIGKC
jgi:hypothetical protein